MNKPKTPFEVPADMRAMAEQSMEQARSAVNNYLQFVQQGVSATQWGGTDLSKKTMTYVERNVASTFEFAQQLLHARDVQDLVRMQTEFVQAQMQVLSEQAKDLGETATKSAMDAFKGVSTKSAS